MKTLKIFLKPISYLIAFLILLQGCTVYKRTPVTLTEAVKANTKVKIKTLDNKTLKYRHIGFQNDKYLGYIKHGKELLRISIKEDMIKKIQLKDNTMSSILTISTIVLVASPFIAATIVYCPE